MLLITNQNKCLQNSHIAMVLDCGRGLSIFIKGYWTLCNHGIGISLLASPYFYPVISLYLCLIHLLYPSLKNRKQHCPHNHQYSDVIMGAMASQITSLTIVYSTVYSGGDQRYQQSSASLAFVQGIHRRPVNSPHKWPVTRKMFPFDDVIMISLVSGTYNYAFDMVHTFSFQH